MTDTNTHFVEQVHRNWVNKYDERCIGNFKDLHPLAQEMVIDNFPRKGECENYRRCIDTIVKNAPEILGGKLRPEQVKSKFSSHKFFRLMEHFALGVQYASRKMHIKPIEYNFLTNSEIKETTAGRIDLLKEAGACVEPNDKKIYINPFMLLEAVTFPDFVQCHFACKPEFLRNKASQAQLTVEEAMLLAGVEEMTHAYQIQEFDTHEFFTVPTLSTNRYHLDPREQEANALVALAMDELQLGQRYRGTKRR